MHPILFAEAVYHVLIVNSLFAQITALSFVLTGPVGRWVTRALQTWLYAYYCHDYLWSARGKPARWRVRHFEGNWCYFAGFGSPIVLISAMNLSTFYAVAVQAMAFPVFMIAAIAAPRSATKRTPSAASMTPPAMAAVNSPTE